MNFKYVVFKQAVTRRGRRIVQNLRGNTVPNTYNNKCAAASRNCDAASPGPQTSCAEFRSSIAKTKSFLTNLTIFVQKLPGVAIQHRQNQKLPNTNCEVYRRFEALRSSIVKPKTSLQILHMEPRCHNTRIKNLFTTFAIIVPRDSTWLCCRARAQPAPETSKICCNMP